MHEHEVLDHIDKEIAKLILAKCPIINIVTYEEQRVLAQLESARDYIIDYRYDMLKRQLSYSQPGSDENLLSAQLHKLPDSYQIIRWTSTMGLFLWSSYKKAANGNETLAPRSWKITENIDTKDPVQVMNYLSGNWSGTVDNVNIDTALFSFCDIHYWLDREDRAGKFNPLLIRTLRDLSYLFRFSPEPHSIILISPHPVVPTELSKDMQVIDYPLPTHKQLIKRFLSRIPEIEKRYGKNSIRLDDKSQNRLMQALCGLTYDEAENVLAKSLVNNGYLDENDISEALAEKRQIIQKDGILEFFDSEIDFTSVGGLELLQEWLNLRYPAFEGSSVTLEGKDIPLPVPRGILLIGVPGCGKSLIAKAIGNAWSLPLLRLDIGRIFGSYLGQSEANMRRAIRVAENVAPAIVWLDEVEKAFPKITSSGDSGASLRVMNTFLTWMQERKGKVFIVGTANDISQMPVELVRRGRFDEIFYVGLPDLKAREKIWEIHTRNIPLKEEHYKYLAARSRLYTGAEIEQLVKNALFVLTRFPEPSSTALEEKATTNPFICAVDYCMKDFVPLSNRKGADGRGLIEDTLEKARAIAAPASAKFEELPNLEKKGKDSLDEPMALTATRF